MMISFCIQGKTVSVFPSARPDRPVIYLNTHQEQGQAVQQALQASRCPECNLVTVSGLDWNRDMAPWDAPPSFRQGAPFTGGGKAYLQLLTGQILPQAEQSVLGQPSWRGIAGYSLAGLFAVYSLYQTKLFSRAASISGSLWFEGFLEYAVSHPLLAKPERVYFSLGKKESQTRNPTLSLVWQNTQNIRDFYSGLGIQTHFQLNPGNHFTDPVGRTAAGIAWLLAETVPSCPHGEGLE